MPVGTWQTARRVPPRSAPTGRAGPASFVAFRRTQHVTEHTIYLGAGDTLTGWFGVLDSFALTDIFRAQTCLTGVVTKDHPSTAFATDDQALQPCRAFARRALSALETNRLRTFSQTLEVLFILLPTNIGRMRFG